MVLLPWLPQAQLIHVLVLWPKLSFCLISAKLQVCKKKKKVTFFFCHFCLSGPNVCLTISCVVRFIHLCTLYDDVALASAQRHYLDKAEWTIHPMNVLPWAALFPGYQTDYSLSRAHFLYYFLNRDIFLRLLPISSVMPGECLQIFWSVSKIQL